MKVQLYDLFPAIYRNRDHYLGGPLRALSDVLSDELDVLRRDIDGLYDDWFIETCDEWVVQYIGDLLAASGLHPGRRGIFSLRAFVANTLAYRRRKGTASVLENIAQDVSGWSASVTEFFQLLTTTQHVSHHRLTTTWSLGDTDVERIGALGNIDIRKERLVASIGTAFDNASHTVDIRSFSQYYGWHNIDRLGIFIWRLKGYPMHDVQPQPDSVHANSFTFHPLGLELPLFTNVQRQTGATTRRQEWEVPRVIDPSAFAADVEQYYGEGKSLVISIEGKVLVAPEVAPADLEDWPQPGFLPDVPALIDVQRGRLVLTPVYENKDVDPTTVRVSYFYGFSADIGGGPYGRDLVADTACMEVVEVAKGTARDNLDLELVWQPGEVPIHRIIRIMDNSLYVLEAKTLTLMPGDQLVIEAAEEARPTILVRPRLDGSLDQLQIEVAALAPLPTGHAHPVAEVCLSGLMIEGRLELKGDLELSIDDCTLLPSRAAAVQDGVVLQVLAEASSYRMKIKISRSIVGGLRVVHDIKHLHIVDSIIDAFIDLRTHPGTHGYAVDTPAIAGIGGPTRPGPATSIESSTVFGAVLVAFMPLASDCIFTGKVYVEERQGGCMRYCYLEWTQDHDNGSGYVSRTPRRYRCQPDLALREVVGDEHRAFIRKSNRPTFSATLYGHPSYARLSWQCPEEIRTGAENGSEMGIFGQLMEPQRENNLREAVRRYLPFGLEMNIIYADEETMS